MPVIIVPVSLPQMPLSPAWVTSALMSRLVGHVLFLQVVLGEEDDKGAAVAGGKRGERKRGENRRS